MPNRTAHANKISWLEKGIHLLSEPEFTPFKVDGLCLAMGLTKGSFYHHFTSIYAYEERLMSLIFERYTTNVLNTIDPTATLDDQLNSLSVTVRQVVPFFLSVNLRKWAMTNPRVRAYQQSADKVRIDFLASLFINAGMSAPDAHIAAMARYTIYTGMEYYAFHYPVSMEQLTQLEILFAGMFSQHVKQHIQIPKVVHR